MEAAASELATNAITKKKELEDYVASLNPAIAAMIVSYKNKPKGQGGSFGGVLADNSKPTNTNSNSTTSAAGNVNVPIPESVKASQFYAGGEFKRFRS